MWKIEDNLVENPKNIKNLNLNFGPQHPAAHGVLRLMLQLNGETIDKLDPHIGLLHRGTEKLIENKIYIKGMPYFDRLDYVSMVTQEHAFCLGIEALLNTKNFTSIFSQIRVLFDELTRILNHLLAIACHALDIGSMSSIFWAFEEREKIMEFYERVSGARMHAALYRPNEINLNALSFFIIEDITEFCRNFYTSLNEIHNVLTYNKIWKQRLVNIGLYDYRLVIKYGLTGVMARCVGIKKDIRLCNTESYANYFYLNFRSYTGLNGDSFDRFLIRMNEMSESTNIICQILNKIKIKEKKNINLNIEKNFKNKIFNKIINNEYNKMEQTINSFKFWSEGIAIKSNFTQQYIESPKGEFGVILFSDNSSKPYKCKIKSPAYINLQFISILAKGHLISDLVALIGTIDIVFGEIDR